MLYLHYRLPVQYFPKIKTIFNSDVDKARNYMFNVDGTNTLNPSDNPNFNPLQQGWQIHSQSWQDSNVINSLRGKLLCMKISLMINLKLTNYSPPNTERS